MSLRNAGSPSSLGRSLVLCSLFWLVLANLVGLLLSLLLSFPDVGDLISPLTYGRWVPLHLNFHLYGWCSLPLVGLLYRWYFPVRYWSSTTSSWTLGLWSLALFFGGLAWLSGDSSGKIFLDWKGTSEIFFLTALTVLWIQLASGFREQLCETRAKKEKLSVRMSKTILLCILAAVPVVFLWVLNPGIFPPINLATSGATGASLLVSSLAVVGIFLALPVVLALSTDNPRAAVLLFGLLGVHFLLWSLISHGNSTHREPGQIAAVFSLLIWAPALWWHYRQFNWSPESLRWRVSSGIFGIALVITAVIMFLPGILDKVKFSQYLVAHVHLAMGGMVSSFLFVILIELPVSRVVREKLSTACTIWIWHLGICLQLVALILLGCLELRNFGINRSMNGNEFFLQLLRFFGGAAMTYCSLKWLITCAGNNATRKLASVGE